MAEREASFFLFEKEPRPMDLERFADVELAIRSLRDMANECIVIDFKDKYENLGFIQAAATVDYKEYHIEIGFDFPDKKVPDIYVNENVGVEETVQIFKDVCTKIEKPRLEGWLLDNFEIFDEDGKPLVEADNWEDHEDEIIRL